MAAPTTGERLAAMEATLQAAMATVAQTSARLEQQGAKLERLERSLERIVGTLQRMREESERAREELAAMGAALAPINASYQQALKAAEERLLLSRGWKIGVGVLIFGLVLNLLQPLVLQLLQGHLGHGHWGL